MKDGVTVANRMSTEMLIDLFSVSKYGVQINLVLHQKKALQISEKKSESCERFWGAATGWRTPVHGYAATAPKRWEQE